MQVSSSQSIFEQAYGSQCNYNLKVGDHISSSTQNETMLSEDQYRMYLSSFFPAAVHFRIKYLMLTQQATLHELLLQCSVDLSVLLSCLVLLHGLSATLLGDRIFVLVELAVLPASERQQVVRLVELFEWSGVDRNDGILHQSLGTDELIVWCIINNVQDASLAGGCLRCPCKVSGLETESSEFAISTASADEVDAVSTQLKWNNIQEIHRLCYRPEH